MQGKLVVGATHHAEHGGAGLSRHAGALTRAMLAHDPRAEAFSASATLRAEHGERIRRVPDVLAAGDFRGNLLRLLWHEIALPRALRQAQAGVFYSTGPDGATRAPCPQVVTVHDVIPLRYPEANPRLQYYYRYILPRVLAASAAVITVSDATRQDLQRFYRLGDTPVHVVHQGYASDIFRPPVPGVLPLRAPGEYLLAVGEGRAYKNLHRLLEGFARARIPGLHLVLAGKLGGAGEELMRLARGLGVEEQLHLVGYVPDAELAALYGAARALVFPSLYEGFGIPPLEAMACGCPVIASRAASIPEICGDAALYIDPLSVDDIAAAITLVVSDVALAERLRALGLARAEHFSYDGAAERTRRIVAEVAEATSARRSKQVSWPSR